MKLLKDIVHNWSCEVWGFKSAVAEYSDIQGCDAVSTGKWLSTFLMKALPSSSGSGSPRMKAQMSFKCWVNINEFILRNIPEDLNKTEVTVRVRYFTPSTSTPFVTSHWVKWWVADCKFEVRFLAAKFGFLPSLIQSELGYNVMNGGWIFCVVVNECRYNRGV